MNAPDGRNDKDPRQKSSNGGVEFNVEEDIAKLKRSGLVAIVLIALLIAFFAVVALNLFGYLSIQQAGDLPPMVRTIYPIVPKLPLYSEPTRLSDQLGMIEGAERLFETKRVPGFAKTEWKGVVGWVDLEQAKSKTDIIAATDEIRSAVRLSLTMEEKWDRADLLLYGKIQNDSLIPVKNIRVAIYFLNKAGEVIFADTGSHFHREPLPSGQSYLFNMTGKDLMGKIAQVANEIADFEPIVAVKPAGGTPEGTPNGNGEAPATAPQAAQPTAPSAPPAAQQDKPVSGGKE